MWKVSQKTITNYDDFATEWQATRRQTWGELEFSKPLLSATKILDAGCGNGRLLTFLHRHNFAGQYLGVDVSQKLLEFAQQDFPQAKFCPANLLTFRPAAKFSAIFCIAVLHHFTTREDQQKVCTNLYANLKPAGQLFLTVWNLWQPKFWPKLGASLFANRIRDCRIPFGSKKVPRQIFAFRQNELKQILATVGFQKIQVFCASGNKKAKILTARNLICLAQK